MPATGQQATTIEPALVRTAGEDDMDAALDTFLAERTRLIRIAYRILGHVTGAEDVVQEVWLGWQLTQREEVDNPTAFLVTATTRLAVNVVRSACHRHEVPVEPQLADLGDRAAPDPVLSFERSVAVEGALALLMARLTPDRWDSATPTPSSRPCCGSPPRTRAWWCTGHRPGWSPAGSARSPSSRTAASPRRSGRPPTPATWTAW
ncbi:sigma factor [Streptomyces sp. 900105755]